MSGAQIALDKLGVKINSYFAAEIDKYAIKVTQANFPNTIQLGHVECFDLDDLPKIDLLIGGPPCQGFSFAGKLLNFKDDRSKLFFTYVYIKDYLKPKYFLLENVKMKQEYQDTITQYLEVQPIEINSALVSAQNRKRLYWTNIPNVILPIDKGVLLKDVLESDAKEPMLSNIYGGFKEKKPRTHFNKSVTIRAANSGGHIPSISLNEKDILYAKKKHKAKIHPSGNRRGNMKFPTNIEGKAKTICTIVIKGSRELNHVEENKKIRILTPIECERLQTVPDNYTNHVSNTQRYKMLGNGFTVDVIAHILGRIGEKCNL